MSFFNIEDFRSGKKVIYSNGEMPIDVVEMKKLVVSMNSCGSVISHYKHNGKVIEIFDIGYDLKIQNPIFYAGIKGARNGTAKEFLIAESIEKLKEVGFTDSDIYKLVPTW